MYYKATSEDETRKDAFSVTLEPSLDGMAAVVDAFKKLIGRSTLGSAGTAKPPAGGVQKFLKRVTASQ